MMDIDIINVTQLEILGFKQEYIKAMFILLILLAFCIVLQPLISFISNKGYTYVLTYVIGSLLFVSTTGVIAQIKQDPFLLKLALFTVSLFGVCLAGYLIYRFSKVKI